MGRFGPRRGYFVPRKMCRRGYLKSMARVVQTIGEGISAIGEGNSVTGRLISVNEMTVGSFFLQEFKCALYDYYDNTIF